MANPAAAAAKKNIYEILYKINGPNIQIETETNSCLNESIAWCWLPKWMRLLQKRTCNFQLKKEREKKNIKLTNQPTSQQESLILVCTNKAI